MSDNNERLYLTILSMSLCLWLCHYGCRCRRKQICCGLVRAFTSLLFIFMSCDVSCLVNGNAGFIHLWQDNTPLIYCRGEGNCHLFWWSWAGVPILVYGHMCQNKQNTIGEDSLWFLLWTKAKSVIFEWNVSFWHSWSITGLQSWFNYLILCFKTQGIH